MKVKLEDFCSQCFHIYYIKGLYQPHQKEVNNFIPLIYNFITIKYILFTHFLGHFWILVVFYVEQSLEERSESNSIILRVLYRKVIIFRSFDYTSNIFGNFLTLLLHFFYLIDGGSHFPLAFLSLRDSASSRTEAIYIKCLIIWIWSLFGYCFL